MWPIEFYVLWTDFEPWKPVDTLTIHMLMAMFLSFDYPIEVVRHKLAHIYDMDFANMIYPWKEHETFMGSAQNLMDEEEQKRQGHFQTTEDIYKIDDNILDIPLNGEGKPFSMQDNFDKVFKEDFDSSQGPFSGANNFGI